MRNLAMVIVALFAAPALAEPPRSSVVAASTPQNNLAATAQDQGDSARRDRTCLGDAPTLRDDNAASPRRGEAADVRAGFSAAASALETAGQRGAVSSGATAQAPANAQGDVNNVGRRQRQARAGDETAATPPQAQRIAPINPRVMRDRPPVALTETPDCLPAARR